MNNVWLIAGAMVGCVGGASLMGACSSGGTSSSSSSSSSSSGAGGSTTSSSSSSAGGGASSSSGIVTDAGCTTESKIQGDLAEHPPMPEAGTATIYCPFSGVDGGDNVYCNAGTEHCCAPSTGTSTCVAIDAGCASGDMDWQCQDPTTDCVEVGAAGSVCCAAGGSLEVGSMMNGFQCENKSDDVKSSVCAASCTGLTLCALNSECTSFPMQTCVAFEKGGAIVGACQ
jgi:hypothetical protein